MTRAFRQQADEQILDRAAALFARHGVEHTSVQAVADAVGLSKAGLLHHFPSKDALHAGVLAESARFSEGVVREVAHLPAGPDRDRRALEGMVDVALAHPGMVAFMLAPVTQGMRAEAAGAGAAALEAFGVDPETADPERVVRVIGALAGLAVLTLAAHEHGHTTAWRPLVLATCSDALGHRHPGSPSSRPSTREA
ncbi:TetR/AcrR family transcriptional regulator [Modestobacter versicolor]|uniref:TetR/AcrR family transcriptional regulator n=1 Tax=Modestobacter versicolor TaxID=429133 RepID=UPI0034DE23F6